MLVGLVNMMTSILALVIIDRVGQKKLVYYGVSGMIVSLLLIGGYFILNRSMSIPSLFLLVFFLCYIFCCAVSICAVVWVLLSEMYPAKIRRACMLYCRFCLVGRNLFNRATYTLDAPDFNPVRYHFSCLRSCVYLTY